MNKHVIKELKTLGVLTLCMTVPVYINKYAYPDFFFGDFFIFMGGVYYAKYITRTYRNEP